jgi:hypothetical protein
MKVYRNVFLNAKSISYTTKFLYATEAEAQDHAFDIQHANGEIDLYRFTIVEDIKTITIKNAENGNPGRPYRKRRSEHIQKDTNVGESL